MPSVAVIVPLYNKEGTVTRTINSIRAQTVRDLDVIVVDDGSTDNSVARVRRIRDSRVRVVQQANEGPGAARNAGAAAADAPLLAFLDADDEWSPRFLERALDALEEQPVCDAFVAAYDTGAHQHRQPNKLLRLGLQEGPWRLNSQTPATIIKKYVDACHSSCVVIRREKFGALGGFFGRDHCLYAEDSYLWMQVVLTGTIYWYPRVLVNFHVEDSSLGLAMEGRHAIRPALTDPQRLRINCKGPASAGLERLLAHYRLLESEKLARQGAVGEIRRLRRLFPGAHGQSSPWRERKLEIKALLAKVRNRWRATARHSDPQEE